MLLTAIWLYRDFPDVDLWLSTADEPSACSLDLPVLLYSIMDRNTTLAAKSSDVGYVDGVPFSIPHLLTGGPPQQQQRGQPVNFTRGYAIPHGQVWDALGMLPTFLSQNQRYQLEASKARQPLLRPQAIWRGSNTGSLRGWPPASDEVPSPYSDPWAPVLFNKRVHLVRLARNHPVTLDVGLHEVTPELLPEELSELQAVSQSWLVLVHGSVAPILQMLHSIIAKYGIVHCLLHQGDAPRMARQNGSSVGSMLTLTAACLGCHLSCGPASAVDLWDGGTVARHDF
jgi:hypothetical protein